MGEADATRGKVREFIREAFFVDELSDDESFLRSGIVDSLGMSQLVDFLEREFAIRVGDEELVPDNLDSVTRAAAFVERKLGRSAA